MGEMADSATDMALQEEANQLPQLRSTRSKWPAPSKLKHLPTGEWQQAPAAAGLTAVPLADRPTMPGEWPIARMIEKLSRELPPSLTETKRKGGSKITFIPWHTANKILDKYAPGWTWEITNTVVTSDRIFVTGRLTIPAVEGNIHREASGTELLKEDKPVMIPNPADPRTKIALVDDLGRTMLEPRELAYGDPSSNAESMAFRRAAARFGLGLYLYN